MPVFFKDCGTDVSAIIKPCLCVSVFGGGTVHLCRVQMKFLCCSVFLNSRIGTSLMNWWRHVTLSHLKLLFVIFNWFPCLIGCSFRSNGGLCIARAITWRLTQTHHSHEFIPGTISSCSWYLDLFLHFLATWLMLCREHASALK